MVQIHNMDSDEELQIVSYEEPDAFAASHAENPARYQNDPKSSTTI